MFSPESGFRLVNRMDSITESETARIRNQTQLIDYPLERKIARYTS